jgi:hypothetical protein
MCVGGADLATDLELEHLDHASKDRLPTQQLKYSLE